MEYMFRRKHPQLGSIWLNFDVNRGVLQISRLHIDGDDGSYSITIRIRGGCWKFHLINKWRHGVETKDIRLDDLPPEKRQWLLDTEDWLNSKECRDRIRQKLLAEIRNLKQCETSLI